MIGTKRANKITALKQADSLLRTDLDGCLTNGEFLFRDVLQGCVNQIKALEAQLEQSNTKQSDSELVDKQPSFAVVANGFIQKDINTGQLEIYETEEIIPDGYQVKPVYLLSEKELSALQAKPEGWISAPVEPDKDMRVAGLRTYLDVRSSRNEINRSGLIAIYKAMIKAAKPDTGEG